MIRCYAAFHLGLHCFVCYLAYFHALGDCASGESRNSNPSIHSLTLYQLIHCAQQAKNGYYELIGQVKNSMIHMLN